MLGERPTYWNTFFDKIQMYTTSKHNFPDSDPNDVIKFLDSFPKYHEPAFKYNVIPEYNKVMLCGYFQSYKYIASSNEHLFDMLDIKFKQLSIKTEYIRLFKPTKNVNSSWSMTDKEMNPKTVSIHFRMGDYKDKQEFHPVLPLDYYTNALAKISSPCHALVFCEKEDSELIRGYIEQFRKRFDQITFTKVDDDIPDWKQMILMSCCNVNIIANSTFSWWGAYLNTSKNKIVLYPDMWFGPSIHENVSDLFPEDWIETACRKIDS